VKLLFKVDPPAGSVEVERMWVEVVDARGGEYSGRLANEPGYLTTVKQGDGIGFGPQHVAARDTGPDDPLFTNPAKFAVVSGRVWTDGAWPGRAERREIPDSQFSGWFVLAGNETEAFKSDPGNFVPIAQGVLFDRFPVLDSGLEGPTGTVMVWDESTLEYVSAVG